MILLLACAVPTPLEGALEVLTYNVHGLPPEITGDDTGARLEAIGPMLADYDLVGVQEDFDAERHELLAAASGQPVVAWFGALLEPERFYGSGLAVLTGLPASQIYAEHFTACNGTVDGASDCLASKGFQVVRLSLAHGVELDVYNTHLEAGSGEDDNAARQAHVDQLVASLNGRSEGRAVVFTGDTNLHLSDPVDAPLLDQLRDDAGLIDACESVGCDEPDRIDRIFVRSGSDLALEVVDWAVDERFVDAEGLPLSDHDAIRATLRWERTR